MNNSKLELSLLCNKVLVVLLGYGALLSVPHYIGTSTDYKYTAYNIIYKSSCYT